MSGFNDTVDRFTATTDAAVQEAQELARQVAAEVDAGTYGLDGWTKSMVRFYDIVARGSAAHLQTALSSSCRPPAPHGDAAGEDIPAPVDVAYARRITIITPFRQVAGSLVIPDAAWVFHPGAVLLPGETSFRMTVTDPTYLGGFFAGEVRLTRITNDPNAHGATDLPVFVAL